MSQMPKAVRDSIRDVRAGRSTRLNFNQWSIGQPLKEIPEEVFALSELEELNLSDNSIRIVPERIRALSKLKKLNLARNPVESIPDIPGLVLDWNSYLRCRNELSTMHIVGLFVQTGENQREPTSVSQADELLPAIIKLSSLRQLQIGFKSVQIGPRLTPPKPEPMIYETICHIGELDQLEELMLHGLMISELPVAIRRVRRLRILSVVGAGLKKVPGWLHELRGLTEVDFSLNHLTYLLTSLAKLRQVQVVDLSGNAFREIPKVLFQMPSLEVIRLSSIFAGNKHGITEIPPHILRLTNLTNFTVEADEMKIPPPEIVEQGVNAIKNYWRQRQESGVDYLCEAKLLIVGEPGAGKTSLARKIEDPACALKPREPSTEGIDVIRWGFPAAIRVRQAEGERLLEREFAVNIWDFGGQEIYHATHQFFLTRRSLYLLVADDRKEDTDFNWWLEVVELLSGGSPLLIVQNEKQDRRRDINLSGLRARFPSAQEQTKEEFIRPWRRGAPSLGFDNARASKG